MRPIYVQVADKLEEIIKRGIENGVYKPGGQLPSYIDLAKTYGIAVNTVRAAIKVLHDRKLVKVEQGRGVFIVDTINEILQPTEYDLLIEINERLKRIEDRINNG